ncbi:hypothetical protein EHQ61_18565 [Leptospira wolffii]|uniref:hypothetical protein n=1 Tax=Leptospira wolffii TaxID=409998 RepID=UPI0010833CEB|nr:hypothetical protein [Leptospira wolffii]TGL45673.1 hypothetical protein EHQ61_18565 [Leptospira wolffii]
MDQTNEERWIDVRNRLQSYIYAIFWQDFDIPSEYSTAAVNRILDGLFKPEYIAVLEDKWSLWVYKDEKRIKVHSDLTYVKAMEMLAAEKESKDPHWVQPASALYFFLLNPHALFT